VTYPQRVKMNGLGLLTGTWSVHEIFVEGSAEWYFRGKILFVTDCPISP